MDTPKTVEEVKKRQKEICDKYKKDYSNCIKNNSNNLEYCDYYKDMFNLYFCYIDMKLVN